MSPRSLKGLVLAGGKGTRLRPLTYTMAKQLVPVANQPILYYALNSLVTAGVRDIGVIISPETGDAVQDAIATWKPAGVAITYIPQDAPKGLAHAVRIAEPYLDGHAFLMILGDNLIEQPLSELTTAFQAGGSDARILLKRVPNPQSFGVAEVDADGRVVRLVEKPANPASDLALVGVYLFTSAIFEAIATIQPSPRGELEITDAIQKLIDTGHTVIPHTVEGWWLDTGKKDDLLEANRIVLDAYCQSQADYATVDSATQMTGQVSVGKGSVVINSTLSGPINIGQNCRIENATLGPHTSIGDNSRIVGTTLDNSVLLDGVVLENLSVRVTDSLIGQECIVRNARVALPTARLLLGDHAIVEMH